MPKPTTLAARRVVAESGRSLPLAGIVVGSIALATLGCGIWLLLLHARTNGAQFMLAPCGVALVACSLYQARAAWVMHRRRESLAIFGRGLNEALARRMVIGLAALYAGALAIGPISHLEYGLATAIVTSMTLLVLPLAAAPGRWEEWTAWLRHRTVRRTEWIVVGALSLVVAVELSLQAARALNVDARNFATSGSGNDANMQSRDAFQTHGVAALPSGPLRVALLTDSQRPDCHGESGCQFHIERSLAGVQIVPVSLVAPWSNMSAAEMTEQLHAADVDLALAMLTVCDELTRAKPRPSWFDWRQLELARMLGAIPAQVADEQERTAAANYESFCGRVAPKLAACRTPIDETMRDRWQETFAGVDALDAACRQARVPLALVLVPGEFQLNAALRETLARRAGYSAEQLDLELPQRKVAGYAAERSLPVVDLLPALRLCRQSPYERHAERFSPAGHEATAAAIGGWLESRYGHQLAAATRLTATQ